MLTTKYIYKTFFHAMLEKKSCIKNIIITILISIENNLSHEQCM